MKRLPQFRNDKKKIYTINNQSDSLIKNRYSIPRVSFNSPQKQTPIKYNKKLHSSNITQPFIFRRKIQSQQKRIKTQCDAGTKFKFNIHKTLNQQSFNLNNFKVIIDSQPNRSKQNPKQPSLKKLSISNQPKYNLPQILPSKISVKQYGTVKAYAANTHQGNYRNYNQDRISIVLNLPHTDMIHYFAIFDGHGGTSCAEYLSNNLHNSIIEAYKQQGSMQQAIKKGFSQLQSKFFNHYKSKSPLQKSGSCALVTIFMNDLVYVANLGDSRALYIHEGVVDQISRDHKPQYQSQRTRIQRLGGKLYRSQIQTFKKGQQKYGPVRVWPGRLTVSRSFGDIEAKYECLGGINQVISSIPDIFQIKPNQNGIFVLACDGIYDRLSNQQIKDIFLKEKILSGGKDGSFIGKGIESCFREAFIKDTFDNISMIAILL